LIEAYLTNCLEIAHRRTMLGSMHLRETDNARFDFLPGAKGSAEEKLPAGWRGGAATGANGWRRSPRTYCSELERTIGFYTEVLGMRLTQIVQNRDDPTSTHIFFDMGGGNQLAFFDFPDNGPTRAVRGVGSMHHVALKTRPAQMRAILARLDERQIAYSMHGTPDAAVGLCSYIAEPDRGRRDWSGVPEAQAPVYGNRRRIRGPRGRRLMRRRG
jgi:catechol 2,3-dioxygenase-like lactoylglutathione lyase family enzyme